MPVITVFNGLFCQSGPVVKELVEASGYKLVTDQDIVSEAAALADMTEEKIARAFSEKTSVFNPFSHEKERAVAYLRLALAKHLAGEDNQIIYGFSAQLPPQKINHIMSTCLIDKVSDRVAAAAEADGYDENSAMKLIEADDKDRAAWVKLTRGEDDPWAASLYDMLVPVKATGTKESVEQIMKQAQSDVLKLTGDSAKAVRDFLLAATVETVLANNGHHVSVDADAGKVTLTINKNVLMLGRLEKELSTLAMEVDGVNEVETKVGKDFHKDDIYRQVNFEMPSRVLLVDDEREFVSTLSERLMLREMGSAVAYDGESALKLIADDAPEVMILDLKMPGIDGIEVLRRVKANSPEVEVIVLTGHGSEEDRKTCMDLGAFAYMHKPVDIEKLSETLKAAKGNIGQQKSA